MTDLQIILIMLAGLVVSIVMMINLLRRLIRVEVGLQILEHRKEHLEDLRYRLDISKIVNEVLNNFNETMHKKDKSDDEY